MQSTYALPPLQSSIHNLRTILRLLSDEEFESEFEIERQRRNSVKQPSAASGNNNNRKRALPQNSTAAGTGMGPKRKKNNDVSRLARYAHDDDDDDDDDDGLRGTSARNRPRLVTNNTSLVDQNAATWDLRFQELVEFKKQHGE
jgi:hypothetical protein